MRCIIRFLLVIGIMFISIQNTNAQNANNWSFQFKVNHTYMNEKGDGFYTRPQSKFSMSVSGMYHLSKYPVSIGIDISNYGWHIGHKIVPASEFLGTQFDFGNDFLVAKIPLLYTVSTRYFEYGGGMGLGVYYNSNIWYRYAFATSQNTYNVLTQDKTISPYLDFNLFLKKDIAHFGSRQLFAKIGIDIAILKNNTATLISNFESEINNQQYTYTKEVKAMPMSVFLGLELR